jgi:hypothetical protein
LEHVVASLQKENEHLKQTYKNLFDSIKRSRVQNQTSNKSDSQIAQNHLFEKENYVLQKKIVELEKKIAQQTKDFGDAKNDFSIETDKYEKYFAHLENQNASLQEKLASSDHLSLQKEYNDLRTSYNALKAKFDVLNRTKGKSQVSNESKPQVSVSEKFTQVNLQNHFQKGFLSLLPILCKNEGSFQRDLIFLKHLLLKRFQQQVLIMKRIKVFKLHTLVLKYTKAIKFLD